MTTDLQCTIDTLNRTILADLRNYFAVKGVKPIVEYTVHNGAPFYLITLNNNTSYVCTKAQWHYFTLKLPQLKNVLYNGSNFRVYPKIQNTAHKNKGYFATIQYTDIGKDRDYAYALANTYNLKNVKKL